MDLVFDLLRILIFFSWVLITDDVSLVRLSLLYSCYVHALQVASLLKGKPVTLCVWEILLLLLIKCSLLLLSVLHIVVPLELWIFELSQYLLSLRRLLYAIGSSNRSQPCLLSRAAVAVHQLIVIFLKRTGHRLRVRLLQSWHSSRRRIPPAGRPS